MVSFLNHVLLDELTANWDLNSAIITGKSIVSKKSAQRIIVMATRNFSQAGRMADEILHLQRRNGRSSKAREFFENNENGLITLISFIWSAT